MSSITILLLALSLSADAFAVAISAGISQKHIQMKQAISLAFCFGLFQAMMPIIGFYGASLFSDIIRDYDHWIALILLTYIGGNMIYEGLQGDDTAHTSRDIFSLTSLFTLSVATSIDALAVGISLTASTTQILIPALWIGIITFCISFIGVGFGKKFSESIGSRAEIVGGIVLIGIGIKTLIEHTHFLGF